MGDGNWGAVISAASALGGLALTGLFGALKGRQERLAQAQADRSRSERRAGHRLERREALHLHDGCREEGAIVGNTRRQAALPTALSWPRIWEDYFPALEAPESEAEYVRLEGPPEVSDAARELNNAALEAHRGMEAAARAHLGTAEVLVKLISDEQLALHAAEVVALREFIARARRALGGDDPGFTQDW
ncbi:hypothetical protein [Streptacidiphilus jiangxiensis]|uniref:hypothetical protein n=1 Tax=Streptacidiphilus jiangxiensis TaxID=235985 RepID=UPI0011606B42|nr:hypothetical protein [Streptacidiphilus jiangxiensis]